MERTLKVLIADDSEDDTLLLVRELRKGGLQCEFERVETSTDLKKSLASQTWDLVFTDHYMPSFGSAEALQIVKAVQPDTPVIVVSGAITDAVAVRTMKSGAQDYIMKDNLARLVPVVERELRELAHRAARKEAESQVAYLAHYDALTKLINRDQFKHHLEDSLHHSRLNGSEHALVYVDLDQFKIINDTCGHLAGDELLVQIGIQIKNQLGDHDYISRMGGDEFGVLLMDCSVQEAMVVATRIHEAIKAYRFVWQEQPFTVSSSIGVVSISATSNSVEEVLASADMACYAAKDKGRSYIQVYDMNDEDLNQRRDQMHWASRVRRALDQNDFTLYRQAIIGFKCDSLCYEFLVRMSDNGSPVPPGFFIPAAERYNLMTHIDRWVIEHAFEHVRASMDRGDVMAKLYFINLSGSSLNDAAFFQFVKDRQKNYAIPADKICFEITETTAIANVELASLFIAEIREMGFLFVLDDFGVGMSSFAYLKAIPVDVLKIDGGFVKNMINDPMDLAIVEACNNIAHSAGLKTVAEFVENKQIELKLRELGVDFAQGYGIEEPKPLPV